MIWLPCTLLMLASYKQALSLQSRKADWKWWLLSQKGFYFGCQLQCPIRWMGMFPEIFQNWVKMDVFSILLPHSLASPPCVLAYIQIKKNLYMYVFIFGCAVSSVLPSGFLYLWRAGFLCIAAHGLVVLVASFVVEHSTRAGGLSCCVWA